MTRKVAAILEPDGKQPDADALPADADMRFARTADELRDAIVDADALLVWDFNTKLVANAWPHANNVQWIQTASAGVDSVMIEPIVNSDVILTNARGVHDRPVAEYTLALALTFAKDLPTTLELQRQRKWQHRDPQMIDGKRMLVVGAGSIGGAIARLASAAGFDVVGVARTARETPGYQRVVATAQLDDELPHADYVVIITPLTNETRGMFDRRRIAKMKPSAVLINVGRGPVVDDDALIDALQNGRIAGAGLDVFGEEPLPSDHPLWGAPNTIISPHMAGDFVGWRRRLAELFADNFQRWIKGDTLRNVVDKQRAFAATKG